MFHAPTLPAPGGASEERAPRRALFARLAPHTSVLLAILAITLIWLDAFDDIFLAHDRTHLQRIVVAAFLTAILLPLGLLIVRYEEGLARARDIAEAATRARSEFLAAMSHEIRTPLTAVLGFVGTLRESKLDTEQRLNATALHAAGDDLLRLLNDIRDLSALDAGRIRLGDVVFAPTAMVEMTASIAKRSATAKGLVDGAGYQDDAAEAEIVDRTAIDEFIAQVGCDCTEEIVTVFLSETERRLSVLRGLPADDHDAIRQEAHTLKGSSGTFGLVRLSMLSRKLERGASGIAPDDYHVALDGLDDVFVRSRRELNIYLRKICESYAELAE